jgi:hypothetical protein
MPNINFGGKDFDAETFQKMIDIGLIGSGAKHDTSSTTPTAQPMHGVYPNNSAQYGPFTSVGARPGMFNATPRVRSIGQYIPLKKSVYRQEIIDVMTGVLAGTGNNVTTACAIGPKQGALKTCRQVYTFGSIHMSTQIVDITKVGQYLNRADVPREIWNNASFNNPWLPQFEGIMGLTGTASQFRANMFAFGVNLEWNVSPVHFKGVAGLEDNTYRGVPRQWAGLDAMYKTGYTDPTGAVCSALDSDVVSFNAAITGDDALGRSIVEAITDTIFGRKEKARALGMGSVTWALVMRPDAFRALTEIWACTYNTYRCAVPTADGYSLNIDAAGINAFRDDMFQNEYLLVDGERVPVILDDTISREVLGNNFYKSDIYLSPLNWQGQDLLYAEYFDQENPQAMEYANAFGFSGSNTITLNDGMYRVFRYETGGCREFDFWSEVRIIQDAPFLAARLDDIQYRSYYKQTDPIPGSSFYADGGVSYRTSQIVG